jgi:hypothetical protein
LIRDLYKSYSQKIVILIDEYDALVLKVINKPILLEFTREVMSNFYLQIKSADPYLDFVFITGCTKFSKMGVFSSLNNLVDISLENEFGSLMGITHEELKDNFSLFISNTAKILNLSVRCGKAHSPWRLRCLPGNSLCSGR